MDLQDIRKQLPSGAIKDIAERAGVSTSTVCAVMKGKRETPKKPKILQTAADYLAEYKEKEREAMMRLKEVATT